MGVGASEGCSILAKTRQAVKRKPKGNRMAPKKKAAVKQFTREQLIAQLKSAELYQLIAGFEGQPKGAQVELDGKHNFTRDDIAAELYKRGRIVPAQGE